MNELPQFRYFPDPIGAGAIAETAKLCECCGLARGYTYTDQIYAADTIETICPWCISDGTAAAKYDGVFVDDHSLIQAGLALTVVDEVSKRTPGYESWQEATWLACCNDACEFHGDETRDYLLSVDQDGLIRLSQQTDFPFDMLTDIIQHYEPRGSPAFYRFRCRHCGTIHHHADYH